MSRVQIADALGKELHPPKMISKPAYGPLDRKPREDIGWTSAGGLKTSDGRMMKSQTLLEGGG